jgi:5'(3')-deoxyribonucleotidase
MKIAFDVDGVVLQSINYILEQINMEKGVSITPDDLFTWDLDAIGVDSETLRKAILRMYSVPEIKPYHGAAETLASIHRKTNAPLLFITGRSEPQSAERQLERLNWLPSRPPMIVTGGARYKLPYFLETGADFIIEDDPEHLQAYLDAGVGVGLMVRPWNRNCQIPVDKRFENWKEVEEWFFSING